MRPWEAVWAAELARLEAVGRHRRLRTSGCPGGRWTVVDGHRCLQCGSNNYLGLADDPRVVAAAAAAVQAYGTGSTGSRLTSGNHALFTQLEAELAAWHGTEAALVFSSGYAVNLAVLTALVRPGDVVFSDRLNHASLIDGCRMCKGTVVIYRHADVTHLEQLLETTPCSGQRWIVTDGVFSMDGDIAPLPALADLAKRYDAGLVVDDAHGVGVLGSRGAGILEYFRLPTDAVAVYIGTLSKALAAEGGYVAGSRQLIDFLVNTARPFIFSTGLAPAVVAAAREARRIAQAEPWRRDRLRSLAARVREGLTDLGFQVLAGETPIVPVVIGEDSDAVRVAEALWEAGVFAPAIRPPSVPDGAARIRLSLTADHTDADADFILEAFERARGSLQGLKELTTSTTA